MFNSYLMEGINKLSVVLATLQTEIVDTLDSDSDTNVSLFLSV